ncbi:alpha/beta hydrolase [Butyrivibrio sp. YAB3001]|uniref:alpha/beta hydrolase n=1 Tax=Butyrivibrio sp. YAB3001 TaxID=1520812 RepID=UPI0008F67163|nr:alpha/beta hydrolase [Butyrivibrio sp. YAB3001]SFB87882.1 Alpha/beta hydrolase family protein [Butyrivibrio sp. YAB3001]
MAFIAMALLVLAIVFKIYASHYYRSDNDIISEIIMSVEGDVNEYSDDDMTVFVPKKHHAKAVIVFYPGGKVEYKAYSGLMYELAKKGYLCVLPRMPENIAFLRINAVDLVKERYPKEVDWVSDVDWYLAGHSLGGVAASQYLYEHLNENAYKGIILCASYTTSDFSGSDIRLLSIYGSNDGVLKIEGYEDSKKYWPEDAKEVIIDGGIHSYFGNYGIQSGDGSPYITNEKQIEITADIIASFLKESK